ncbi:HATPase_c domain-containing protein, partial [Haematococcus lacustris]
VLEVEYANTEDKRLRGQLRDPNSIEAQITALQVSALKRINKGTKVVLLDRYGPAARTVAKELGRKGYTKVFVVAAEETYQYQAEVDRLMDMIVNSLYSNREVFLRELISNASDALDKVRFVAVTKPEVMKGREEIEIKVKADKNTIVIEDSGIGMTREQLLSNLGTIARSGTRKFLEMQKEQKAGGDSNLIGQFGVGFYSAFLVADRVVVQSKSADEGQQWVWEAAAGSHQYKIYEDKSGEDLVRGTRVTLHLKEDAQELADPIRLSRLIKQYSQFISFPIKLYNMKKEPAKVVDAEATKRKQDAENKRATEKAEEPVQVEPVMKTEYQEVWDWRVENENKPLWTRAPK